MTNNELALPIMAHLRELRRRLFWCFSAFALCTIPGFFLYSTFIDFLIAPFEKLGIFAGGKPLYITNVFEGFWANLKYSFIIALILSLPIHIYHLIRFIFPGLKKRERTIIILTLISGACLSALAIYFIYNFMFPLSLNMLTDEAFIPKKVGLILNFQTSISYMFNFLLCGMIAFQFPIILEILLYLKILKRKTLWKASRYVVVLIFIIAAIVTPPDAISQVSFAAPMIGLYFLALLIAKIFNFGGEEI
jgi:sec-independent protein translocase protein TatC